MKKIGKWILCSVLERQVKRIRTNNKLHIIAVGGSVGKTSTKLAIARTLGTHMRVQFQDGNYNDRLTVPLVFFNETEPAIYNVYAWLRLLLRSERQSRRTYNYDCVVLELGTDGPGQLKAFAYLHPDMYVLTAVAEEHMEFFGTIAAVATEELVPVQFSKTALINCDDVAPEYLPNSSYKTYSSRIPADYQVRVTGQELLLTLSGAEQFKLTSPLLGAQGAKAIVAAAATASLVGFTAEDILKGLQSIQPVPGRMQVLAGAKDTVLIDDTYNASPLAVRAALDVLYSFEAPQRIAILGSMNELGADTAAAHASIGNYCDPDKLDVVVTIGALAKSHLAPAARARGCQVVSFMNPVDAGNYVREKVRQGGVVLAKGSQNGVFAEEAVKQLLENTSDVQKLVRQSPYWLNQKAEQFP